MKRALVLFLLLTASTAFAQSDTRKVAVFTFNATSTGNSRTAPVAGGGNPLDSYRFATLALERMGVPYTVFNCADSAGGWASTMGATRPAGTADSTWFRQNGYFMVLMNFDGISSSVPEPAKSFQDGRTRGSYIQSPLSGRWGIPCLVFTSGAESNGLPYVNGAKGDTPAAPYAWQGFFSNNDTMAVDETVTWVNQPNTSDSVTVIVAQGDSLYGVSTHMVAWRYKTSTLYFPTVLGKNQAMWTLLGLSTAFRDAGYTPRQKLNFKLELDHPAPENTTPGYTAPSDTVLAYYRKNNWRPALMLKSHGIGSNSSEYANASGTMHSLWNDWARAYRLPVIPHSHTTGVGNYYQATSVSMVGADTATVRARWNFMERAITDTLGLYGGKGYERTIGFAGDGVLQSQMYIFAQNGYTDVRVPGSGLDSIGVKPGVNLHAANQIWTGFPVGTTSYAALPYRWIDAGTGKTVWIHSCDSYPGGSDTTWADLGGHSGNFTLQARTLEHLMRVGVAILNDGAFYWHPNQSLETSPASTNNPVAVLMRRMSYYLNRVSNIVTVEPSYRPRYPRRSSIRGG